MAPLAGAYRRHRGTVTVAVIFGSDGYLTVAFRQAHWNVVTNFSQNLRGWVTHYQNRVGWLTGNISIELPKGEAY